jgi:hypothetical protein
MQDIAANLSLTEQALLLAAFFRGNPHSQTHWTSSCDQVIALSLFYTGDMSFADCEKRFETGYVSPLYDNDGGLLRDLRDRYNELIELIRRRHDLISGGGNLDTPADPTYTACKLTQDGIRLIPDLVKLFPAKPDFANWPDKNELPPK